MMHVTTAFIAAKLEGYRFDRVPNEELRGTWLPRLEGFTPEQVEKAIRTCRESGETKKRRGIFVCDLLAHLPKPEASPRPMAGRLSDEERRKYEQSRHRTTSCAEHGVLTVWSVSPRGETSFSPWKYGLKPVTGNGCPKCEIKYAHFDARQEARHLMANVKKMHELKGMTGNNAPSRADALAECIEWADCRLAGYGHNPHKVQSLKDAIRQAFEKAGISDDGRPAPTSTVGKISEKSEGFHAVGNFTDFAEEGEECF